jgi:hypothetical protein
MLPASNLFFTVGTLVAERLLYMPSVGLVLLFAHGMVAALRRYRDSHGAVMLLWAVCVVLLALGCERTLSRTEDWVNDEALYSSAVQVCPNSAKNRHQLGQIYMNQAADIQAAVTSGGGGGGVGEVAAEEVAELTAKALRQFKAVEVIDPTFCDVQHNLGQHYIAVCQEQVISAVQIANHRGGGGDGPLRMSECSELALGLSYLRQNVDCIFTNMKSYPLLMQVYNILLEEEPLNGTIWGGIAEVYEAIGDEDAAAAQYTSQGQALLKHSSDGGGGGGGGGGDEYGVAAVGAFERAVELAPEVCEYSYWLADAMHSVWKAQQQTSSSSSSRTTTTSKKSKKGKKGKKKTKQASVGSAGGGLDELRKACEQLEQALDCVSAYRELHDNQPYPAHLQGREGDGGSATAITEGNFVPTLVEWLSEGVAIALQGQQQGGEAGGEEVADAEAAGAAAPYYEKSARALRRLQPDEAEAGEIDVESLSENYMLQAAIGYASKVAAETAAVAAGRRQEEEDDEAEEEEVKGVRRNSARRTAMAAGAALLEVRRSPTVAPHMHILKEYATTQAVGCWLLAAGCWLLAAGFQAAGCWLLAAGCWFPG